MKNYRYNIKKEGDFMTEIDWLIAHPFEKEQGFKCSDFSHHIGKDIDGTSIKEKFECENGKRTNHFYYYVGNESNSLILNTIGFAISKRGFLIKDKEYDTLFLHIYCDTNPPHDDYDCGPIQGIDDVKIIDDYTYYFDDPINQSFGFGANTGFLCIQLPNNYNEFDFISGNLKEIHYISGHEVISNIHFMIKLFDLELDIYKDLSSFSNDILIPYKD